MNDYDEVLITLRRITRAIDLHSKHLQKTTGLTTSQLIVMEAIDNLGSPAPSAIAREVVLSQATVTSIIDRLVSNKLAIRRPDTEDKRQIRIDLTDAGRLKLVDAPALLQSGFLSEYRKLPEWHRKMLVASLQQIAEMMDATKLDASPILDVGDLGESG